MTPDGAARPRDGAVALRTLFTASFAALYLELLLIRWITTEIPVLAYLKNLPLLAIFAGLSAGLLRPRDAGDRFPRGVWLLAALGVLLALAGPLGLSRLACPDPYLDMWDRGLDPGDPRLLREAARSAGTLGLILAACALAFTGLGGAMAPWFARAAPLAGYGADLAGGFAGVAAFGGLSALGASPLVWTAGALPPLWIAGRALRVPARRLAPPLLALLAAGGLARWRASAGDVPVRWSPYYRIDLAPLWRAPDGASLGWRLEANHTITHVLVDLRDGAARSVPPEGREDWKRWRAQYDFPYRWTSRPPARVLIVGAGTGNDAAAALRHGAARVTAVEIDGAFRGIGLARHPERPYADPRVRFVADDARAFLRRTGETYDLITYSIVDSLTALSTLSSIRLENYVWTVEGIRDALARLAPDGVMTVSFYASNRPWLGRRIANVVTAATGRPPVCARLGGCALFAFGPGITGTGLPRAALADGVEPAEAEYAGSAIRPSTDDWPFLYANPAGLPIVYLGLLGLLVVGARALVRRALGGGGLRAALDWPMFYLGAGFMLVEAKALAEIPLWLGVTWRVNLFVVGGVLALAWLANVAVARRPESRSAVPGVLLAAALAAWTLAPRAALNALPYAIRAPLGTAVALLPILFAGVVFSRMLRRRADPASALGANLLGAVVGGASEASSVLVGIRALSLLALGFYAAAWSAERRR